MKANEKSGIAKWLFAMVFGIVMMASCVLFNTNKTIDVGASALDGDEVLNCFSAGEYKTSDNSHTIEIDAEGSILFDNTYTLTASNVEGEYVLEGSLGTSKTSAKFIWLNEHALMLVSHIKYTVDTNSYIMYQNTPFLMDYTPVENINGGIELWTSGVKSATFDDFQSAIVSASDGDTIKLTRNMTITEGATIMGKNITIDGGNFTIDKSSWANTVFAVADNATLNINNLTIDGKATGWDVDFDAVTFTNGSIPLKANSVDNDPVSLYPAITTSGKLNADNLTIENIYSTTSAGIGITMTKGELDIQNSKFIHNQSMGGGAILIGATILESELEEYHVTHVDFTNTNFINNYSNSDSGNGGAIYINAVKEVNFEDCTFNTNVANGNTGYGGAIFVSRAGKGSGYNSTAHKLGLPFPQISINNSEFLNNWTGNDGSAINNYDAEFTITNTQFVGNVGVWFPQQSIACFSCNVERSGVYAIEKIENCLFERNKGVCSGFADHGTFLDFRVKDTTFRENEGNTTIYLLTGVVSLEGCTFENEKASRCVLHCVPNDTSAWYAGSGKSTSTIVIKDTTFDGTASGVDVRLNSDSHADTTLVEAELYIEGETNANIQLRDESHLILNGKLTGDVILDERTPADNVVFGENAEMEGSITTAVSRYYVTFNFLDDNNEDQTKQIVLEINRQYSNEEIQELLGISKEGYIFKVYTNNTYTTEWTYAITKGVTLYGRWEEHNHTFDTYTVNGSSIEKICECGKIEGSLAISANANLIYTGSAKTVNLTNTLDAQDDEYTITYFVKLENDIWVKSTSPVNVGTYKAILNYQNNSAELLFNIEKATYDLSNVTFESKEFTYDGNKKSLAASGLPQGVSVTYVGNEKTEVGTYLVTAKFTVDSANYNEIADMSAILQIKEVSVDDTASNDINYIHCAISALAGIVLTVIICSVISLIKKKK